MAKTTFWDIIISTLEKEQKPLSPKEIWKKANDYKLLAFLQLHEKHLGQR